MTWPPGDSSDAKELREAEAALCRYCAAWRLPKRDGMSRWRTVVRHETTCRRPRRKTPRKDETP